MYATCAGQHTVDTKYWPHQQTPSFICTPHKLPAADYDFADSPLQTVSLAHWCMRRRTFGEMSGVRRNPLCGERYERALPAGYATPFAQPFEICTYRDLLGAQG
jgi:hypothetical protein